MTLKTRNRLLLVLIVISISFLILFSIISLVSFIKGNFSLIPKFTRVLPINSESFLLKNSSTASILSILALLLYIPISSYFLYVSFEKTKSPETIYLMGFFTGCLLQTTKILIVLLNLYNTSSSLLFLVGRLDLMGKLLAPICLLLTAVFPEQDQIQDADKNYGLAICASIFIAHIVPINTTKIFSNLSISCGFNLYLYIFILTCALMTVIAFLIVSYQRNLHFWESPSPYYFIMFLGYISLTISDCFLLLFIGIILLVLGSYKLLSNIHKYYLWK